MKYQVMPDLTPIEYEALKADIEERGVLVPVEVDETGAILDGHHRVKAWQELRSEGVNLPDYPRMIRTGLTEEQKRNHARSLNVLRRHLSREQRDEVMRAMRADGMTYQEIADRVGVSYGTVHNAAADVNIKFDIENSRGQGRPATYAPRSEVPTLVPGLFVTTEAKQDEILTTLQKVQEQAPDLYDAARSGEIKPTAVERELRMRQKKEAPPLPSGKYRVWYADPPWPYNNAGVITDNDAYGRAARHYPTMSIAELCAMGAQVREMVEPNAVLFMWVTSPLLEECFDVIRAWGFEYKTSFVWDKVGHNFGHYNSVRHELLLVCARGSCTPDNKTLYDSVVSIEKSSIHSEKPAEFRRIIDDLYTWGNRIELFARCQANGWDVWGNEA